MPRRIRTFVAVELDDATRRAATDLIEEFRGISADVKWVESENLHLTLKFLGEVEEREIHRVCQIVERAVAEIAAFDLEVRGVGAFPNPNRPRTIWLGGGRGSEELGNLAARIESALAAIGYPKESRRFSPHLTIGRVRNGGPAIAPLAELIHQYADRRIGTVPVSEVTVFSSVLGRSGPTYDALARGVLNG
jgi:2'-5' RNA ligase